MSNLVYLFKMNHSKWFCDEISRCYFYVNYDGNSLI